MNQNTSIKEKILHPEQSSGKKPLAETPLTNAATQADECVEELDERLCTALRAASDKKALDMVVLDLRELASFTDYFFITSGTNVRQVQAIADEVVERLKKQGTRAERVEGYNTAEWILVDYGDFIVHVFEDKSRKFYDLERLWREAKRVELPAELKDQDAGGSSLRRES
ncbi:MAG TPA: ribosome silencing factor [Pyrinomonadaceae bacterium]|jgi:ribosome-associated protein|nr:ribosome silencing factor [Pyrinomonadaceae bacterium]